MGADDYLFRYGDKTLAHSAVSLSMPVRAEEYRRRELHPIFQMNLPEGYVLEQLTTLMGLSAEQKYTKSYAAIAKAVRVFCAPAHQRSSLDQLFDSVALSCIVGNGDAHLKNFGVLYSDPVKSDTRLAPAYDIVNTTAYIPEDTLALDLSGNKSLFASRLGILEFARTCEVEKPETRIQALLQTLEITLKREDEYCRLAPDVATAIRQSAQGYQHSFGG